MSSGQVVWAEAPDDDREEGNDTEAHGDVDESFPLRRLRRWLDGMFGGKPSTENKSEPEQ